MTSLPLRSIARPAGVLVALLAVAPSVSFATSGAARSAASAALSSASAPFSMAPVTFSAAGVSRVGVPSDDGTSGYRRAWLSERLAVSAPSSVAWPARSPMQEIDLAPPPETDLGLGRGRGRARDLRGQLSPRFSPAASAKLSMFGDKARRSLEPRLRDIEVRGLEAQFAASWADVPDDPSLVSHDVGRAVRKATARVVVRSLRESVSIGRRRGGSVAVGAPGAEMPTATHWRFGISHGLPRVEMRRDLARSAVKLGVEARGLIRASLERGAGAAEVSYDLDERRVFVNWRLALR